MAAKQNQSKEDPIKDPIKDRSFMRRVAHGYDMQIAPGVWTPRACRPASRARSVPG